MKKTFCDCCGAEIDLNERTQWEDSLLLPIKDANFGIIQLNVALPHDKDVCDDCVLNALGRLDKRPLRWGNFGIEIFIKRKKEFVV